jgi:hypothetical protein
MAQEADLRDGSHRGRLMQSCKSERSTAHTRTTASRVQVKEGR